ncbi:RIP metalloprotease RseP [Actibacterium ureilyticum]|uniref:RIP metalloprotease RseP n=1 Tax=Actibacterium ureilyticum TaxID=1590614 RepID=UPI000BAABA4F|nr:RIP metalloprotease RseP [Actibacterium ureilyticum]
MDVISQLPNFGNIGFTVVAFIVALSVIVAIHEFGHYIVARWCGIYSEVFSIGFGPVLFSREDSRGTKWQIAALPLGGYVKFLGDASAASDKASDTFDQLDEETKRHTMHGAPLWARAATVAAGPVFNFVLSILIFSAMLMWRGQEVEPPTIGALADLPAAQAGEGLQPGDTILGIGGQTVTDYGSLYEAFATLPLERQIAYRIDRDGTQQDITGPYPFPVLIDSLQARSAAIRAGLKVGDVITHVDGEPIIAFSQLQEIVGASEGRELDLTVWRDGTEMAVTLAPKRVDLPTADGGFETRWLIGLTGALFFTPERHMPSFVDAVSGGAEQMVFIVKSSLSGLYHIVTGAISTCNLSGPLGIAQTTGAAASQGLSSFIWFIAVLSTAVGMLNLFPIPVLDGGHLVFHAYEALTGRPPSDGALRVLMGAGLMLLLSLMVFSLTNDVFCP